MITTPEALMCKITLKKELIGSYNDLISYLKKSPPDVSLQYKIKCSEKIYELTAKNGFNIEHFSCISEFMRDANFEESFYEEEIGKIFNKFITFLGKIPKESRLEVLRAHYDALEKISSKYLYKYIEDFILFLPKKEREEIFNQVNQVTR